jgi:hypothetical protein
MPRLEVLKRLERFAARVCAHDAISIREPRAEIVLDCLENVRVIVDNEQDWFCHVCDPGSVVKIKLGCDVFKMAEP